MAIKASVAGWYQISSHPKHIFYLEKDVDYNLGPNGMPCSDRGPASVQEFKEPVKSQLKRAKNQAKRRRRKFGRG